MLSGGWSFWSALGNSSLISPVREAALLSAADPLMFAEEGKEFIGMPRGTRLRSATNMEECIGQSKMVPSNKGNECMHRTPFLQEESEFTEQ